MKVGLVDKDRLQKAKAKKRKPAAKKRAAKRREPTEEERALRQQRAEKAERDRELNQQREEVRRQREVAAQVRQLVRAHRVPRSEHEDDRPFHFDNKGKVKRIFVSDEQHRLITAGRLVIVNDNGVFELVPPAIAEKIRRRNPSLVIDLPEDEGTDADDPYAQFQVPDDLMW